MTSNFFKITWRNLWKNRGYSSLNIFGLAIGIACAGLIFLWVEDEMTFDNVNQKKNRLYAVRINAEYDGNMYTMGSTSRLMASSLKTDIPGIVNAARVYDESQRSLFSFDNKSLYASGRYADSSLFSMFTLPFIEGDAQHAFAQLHSIVITEKTAKKFFGEEKNVMGKNVRVDNKQDYVVAGVLKDLPVNSSLQFEWLEPFENDPYNSGSLSWSSYGPFTYVELDAKANLTTVNAELQNYIHQKEPSQTNQAFLFPMKDWRLYDEFANGKQTGSGGIRQVRMLSTIAWIILFIACINFMNLATANGQRRAKEVGVRKVLGSGKNRLVTRFIGETLFMSAIAAVAAIIIMSFALPAFNMLMQKQLSLDISNPFHILGLLIITVISGLVAGSYPSLYLSSFNPAFVLKGLKLKTGSAAFIRKGLVVLQFGVSVVFIISTIIVYKQIQHVKSRELGFNKNNLIQLDMQHDIAGTFPLIKRDLLHTGLIENAATSDHATIYGGNTDDRFKWQGKAPDKEISIAFRNVSPEFVSTSGMQIIEGRDFNPDAGPEKSNVVINQSLAKMMGKESAVGKIIQSARGNEDDSYSNYTVVGVIKDYVYGNMYGQSGPLLFFCKPPQDDNFVYVRTKPMTNPEQALTKIEAVLKKDNPAFPLQYKFVDEQFNAMFNSETLTSRISGLFAVLAIIISCLGLFGLAAYTAERRTKEIGVRKVLGASVTSITRLLSKEFIWLVFIACVIAFPVAWWMMHNWLQNYSYRIAISGWIFIAAGMGAMLIALVTVSFQAIKVAIANPVKSLRTE
jgi:predicted permease